MAPPRNRRGRARRQPPATADIRRPARRAEASPKPARGWERVPPPEEESPTAGRSPAYFLPSTVSFKLLARRNLHTRLAGILIGSPVCGLRPMRALRLASTSLPKPGSTNAPLFFASPEASTSVSSRILSVCFFERLVFSARWASGADFVIVFATGSLL